MTAPGTDADDGPDVEFGHWLFAQPCDFVQGAALLGQVPDGDLPEIAFAGRSNVGKSSLINAITGRKTLARTSNTPGRTREINFFDLAGRLTLVDLPGYGFARVSKADKNRWAELINGYLRGRVVLRRVCLLIDARHGVMASDRELMAMLDAAAVVYQLILTKADKPKKGGLEKCLAGVVLEAGKHTAAHPDVMPTSAVKGTGIAEGRAQLATLAVR